MSDDWDFSGLTALFVNCTLKRSPEPSHTQGLIDASSAIMFKHGVTVEEIRAVDLDIATGVYPDMWTSPRSCWPPTSWRSRARSGSGTTRV
jgi:hypothetical protein